jgi:hypothetical protein
MHECSSPSAPSVAVTVPFCHIEVVGPDEISVAGALDYSAVDRLRPILCPPPSRGSGAVAASTVDLTRATALDREGVRLLYEAAVRGLTELVTTRGSTVEQVVRISGLSRVLRLRRQSVTDRQTPSMVERSAELVGRR